VVEELTGGAVQREYTYGLQRIDENQVISSTWTPSFYGYDGAGSVRQLTNTAGVVTDTYEYDAWGNEVNSTGTTPNSYLYRAEQYDSDLGLYYLRARYYNPATGRFLSRDPEDGNAVDPASLHKYLYAGGDPVDMLDPTGRDLVSFELQLRGILKKAPTLAALGWSLAKCVAAIGVAEYKLTSSPNQSVYTTLSIEAALLQTCSTYFFNSFRYVFAMVP